MKPPADDGAMSEQPVRIHDDGSKSMPERVRDLEQRTNAQDERIDKLERWQSFVIGAAMAVGAVFGAATTILALWK